MLNALKLKPVLAATTSAAALAVGLVVFLPQTQMPAGRMATPPAAPAPEALSERSEAQAEVATLAAPEPEAAPDAAIARKAAPAEAVADVAMEAPVLEPSLSVVASEPMAPPPAMDEDEAFANAGDNPVQVTREVPVSTFSVDVDTASYAIVRDSLLAGVLPPPAAVRVE